jgi:hypothetical protein
MDKNNAKRLAFVLERLTISMSRFSTACRYCLLSSDAVPCCAAHPPPTPMCICVCVPFGLGR